MSSPKQPLTKGPGPWRQFKALVLNMPDPEVPSLADRLRGKGAAAPPSPVAPEQPPETPSTSAWTAAAAKATANEPEEGDGALWTPKNRKPSSSQRILRWVLIGLILLFAWIGLRAATVGINDQQGAPELPASVTFPDEAVSGPAERFAEAYLTWNEDDEGDSRGEALSRWYSGGEAANGLGWDGKGRQEASNATALNVEPLNDHQARVTVVADVTPYKDDKAQPTQPTAIEVKVQTTAEGTAVYGIPGVVGLPSPIQADEPQNPAGDSNLTRETRSDIESFFSEYGESEDLSTVTAPGSDIQGLNGALSAPQLRDWTVFQGEGDERTARAVVEWTTPSGAKSEQSYEITLVRVSGGEAARWQISTVKGTN